MFFSLFLTTYQFLVRNSKPNILSLALPMKNFRKKNSRLESRSSLVPIKNIMILDQRTTASCFTTAPCGGEDSFKLNYFMTILTTFFLHKQSLHRHIGTGKPRVWYFPRGVFNHQRIRSPHARGSVERHYQRSRRRKHLGDCLHVLLVFRFSGKMFNRSSLNYIHQFQPVTVLTWRL